MKRIPEPELMNDAEQAEAYAGADFSEPHNAFVADFIKHFPGFSAGEVLDLGCGTADVITRFAASFPKTLITGIDGAGAMLDFGRQLIESRGLADRINLMQCLLPCEELTLHLYDAVISNSLLHHLHDPFVLWSAVRDCSRKGASIFIMDLMRPENTGQAEKLVQLYASDEPTVLQSDFFNSLLAAYSPEEIKSQLETASMGYLNVESVSDRHLIIWGKKC